MKRFIDKYRHGLVIIIYSIVYILMFGWLEHRPIHSYHIVHTVFDDWIPFCEFFIVPYMLWFPYMILAVAYFIFFNKNKHEYYQLAFNLLDTLTISENIALALSINKTPARDVEPRIQDIAQKLNITDILNKYPYQVSGGQKQRCACARAIINNPKLLLADEPTGALDSHSAQMLLSTIQSINEQLSATILMVTHDAFTASYASRILFLQDGAIFTELRKGNDSRSAFFEKILNVLTMIGGGQSHVC